MSPNKNNTPPPPEPANYQRAVQRYQRLYHLLLQLYPEAHRRRFATAMAQTFADLLQERVAQQKGLSTLALWLFLDTLRGAIKENLMLAVMQKKDVVQVISGTAMILLLPLVGTYLSAEVSWKLGDFVIAAFLLMSTGFAFKFMSTRFKGLPYQMAVGLASFSLLLLVWMNLAVGLLGNEGHPANLMYLGVIAIGIAGAFVTHAQPRGMVQVMGAMALAQMLIAALAVMMGLHQLPGQSMTQIISFNGLFTGLFLISALLFQQAVSRKNSMTNLEA